MRNFFGENMKLIPYMWLYKKSNRFLSNFLYNLFWSCFTPPPTPSRSPSPLHVPCLFYPSLKNKINKKTKPNQESKKPFLSHTHTKNENHETQAKDQSDRKKKPSQIKKLETNNIYKSLFEFLFVGLIVLKMESALTHG